MKLYLIGLLGSGKSVLGRKIAESLSVPFIDLDLEIEKEEGMTIEQLFTAKGEEYFRNSESTLLKKLSATSEFVMATGGGTPCFHDNLSFINQTGTSIFLNTVIKEIAGRLKGKQKEVRPLLAGVPDDQLEQKLEEMLQQRLPFYRQAHFTLDGSAASASEAIRLLETKK